MKTADALSISVDHDAYAYLRVPVDMMPRLINETAPAEAEVVENVAVGSEDLVPRPVVARKLPDVLIGLSSGHLGGSGTIVMLDGATSVL